MSRPMAVMISGSPTGAGSSGRAVCRNAFHSELQLLKASRRFRRLNCCAGKRIGHLQGSAGATTTVLVQLAFTQNSRQVVELAESFSPRRLSGHVKRRRIRSHRFRT